MNRASRVFFSIQIKKIFWILKSNFLQLQATPSTKSHLTSQNTTFKLLKIYSAFLLLIGPFQNLIPLNSKLKSLTVTISSPQTQSLVVISWSPSTLVILLSRIFSESNQTYKDLIIIVYETDSVYYSKIRKHFHLTLDKTEH